jgi:hypothetical protein
LNWEKRAIAMGAMGAMVVYEVITVITAPPRKKEKMAR